MTSVLSSQVIGFGSNYFSALGGTDEWDSPSTPITPDSARILKERPWEKDNDPVIDVQCSTTATLFLTRSGKVYQVGVLHGQLSASPTKLTIPLPRPVKELACGRHYCLALADVVVLAWGAGHFGQLGLGPHVSVVHTPTVIPHLLPQALGPDTCVVHVAAGSWHASAMTQQRVFMWGSNRRYQCGRKSPSTLVVPQPLEMNVQFRKLSLGKLHSMGLTTEGKVYCWGASPACGHSNSARSRGNSLPKLVESLSRVAVVDISAGHGHSLCLTGGGRVFAWGAGSEGQLGTGVPVVMQGRPKLVSDLDFVAIVAGQHISSKSAGGAQSGSNPSLPTSAQILPKVPKIVSVHAYGTFSVAKSSAGHVYTWGCNDAGVLGIPTPEEDLFFIGDPQVMDPGSLKAPTRKHALVKTFDSKMNVLLPQRVDCVGHLDIALVAGGPAHLWVYGVPRQTPTMIGRTLYEIEQQHTEDKGEDSASILSNETDVMTTVTTLTNATSATAGTSMTNVTTFSTTSGNSFHRDPRPLMSMRGPGTKDSERGPTRNVKRPRPPLPSTPSGLANAPLSAVKEAPQPSPMSDLEVSPSVKILSFEERSNQARESSSQKKPPQSQPVNDDKVSAYRETPTVSRSSQPPRQSSDNNARASTPNRRAERQQASSKPSPKPRALSMGRLFGRRKKKKDSNEVGDSSSTGGRRQRRGLFRKTM